MKQACAKCATLQPSYFPPSVPSGSAEEKPQNQEDAPQPPIFQQPSQPSFDAEKLHQAILAFRPVSFP